jgi:DNA-binding transcriptional regulator GbsR (MarR family)
MNEIEIINKFGALTSAEIASMVDKSQRAVSQSLKTLETFNMISVVQFKFFIVRRNIYLKNEIYNNLSSVKEC